MTNKEIIELMRKQLDQQQIQLQLQREQLEQQNNAILQALQMTTRQERPAETTNQQVAEVHKILIQCQRFQHLSHRMSYGVTTIKDFKLLLKPTPNLKIRWTKFS